MLTFGRILINQETSQGYLTSFSMFFGNLNLALVAAKKQCIEWFHHHGRGIHAVVADMCPKQAHGKCQNLLDIFSKHLLTNYVAFGEYLVSIDPLKTPNRDWRWQLRRTLIFCSVHYKRGLDKCVREGKIAASSEEFRLLLEILTLDNGSREEILADIMTLLAHVQKKWYLFLNRFQII